MNRTDNILLTVLTPKETLFEGYVAKVELPGEKGRFMVLQRHAPLISSLVEGDVVYAQAGVESRIHLLNGFVKIYDDKITVCAEV